MSEQKELLQGIRVLELGSLIAGPFAGRLFADFGAEVIKVETPKVGDPFENGELCMKEHHSGGMCRQEIRNRSH